MSNLGRVQLTMAGFCAALSVTCCMADTTLAAHYTISGAGNSSANGDFYASGSGGGAKWVSSSSGMQLFPYKGRWYLGWYGTGPVLYEGACPSASPPLTWSVNTWKGHLSPAPPPRLTASPGLQTASCGPPCAYTLTHAGSADANGCYRATDNTSTSFQHTGSSAIKLYRRAHGEWVIGDPGGGGGGDLYVSNCGSATEPPACESYTRNTSNGSAYMPSCGWHVGAGGLLPGPTFSASVAFPLGYCPPGPAPKPKPHPRCVTPECPHGCPDLHSITPDLVRPPMVRGMQPQAGVRVRAVAPGFESTQVRYPNSNHNRKPEV